MADFDSKSLMDITLCPSPGTEAGSQIEAVTKSIQDHIPSKIIHLFKVEGENRILAVLKGGTEAALTGLNSDSQCGGRFTVNTTPLVSYEHFSKNVLKVDEDLCVEKHDLGTDDDGVLFWNQLKLEYKDKPMTELLEIWKEEAETVFGGRKKGLLNDLYKIVGQREIIAFIRASPERLDGASFALPMMVRLGDQITSMNKRIFKLN